MLIDAHVHLVGNGASGSGCWYRPRGIARLARPVLLRRFGLTGTDLRGDFDRLYLARLVELLRDSSLDALALFAQDEVYREDGSRWEGRGTFFVPNGVVLDLAREQAGILPVVSIHPARPDALDELDRCAAAGAVALKLLPNCHNVDCGLPRYAPFWDRMAALRLPLIAHTGCEHIIDEVRSEFGDPLRLRAPLEAGVTVIAAHCGTRSVPFEPDYFPAFQAMLAAYPNLYGDTAAFNLTYRCVRFRACLRPGVVERLVHGSDLPVPVLSHPGLFAGLFGVADWWRLRRIRNPLERDYRLKRAMGFPETVFTRAAQLLRLPGPPPPAPAAVPG